MTGFIEDAKIISSFHRQSKTHNKILNRKHNVFIFRITGSVEYTFGNKTLTVKAGDAIFIPQGTTYEYNALAENHLYTSINFSANLENPKPTVYSTNDFYGINYIYENFAESWQTGSVADKYKCLSVFYDFLSYIARLEHLNDLDKHKHYIIKPALEYLKRHLFDCHLKVDNLHRLCCISDTYFRKLFFSKFNLSPQEYVITERLSHAKTIIESTDYDSIAEVAELVGYKDPLYFSKAFKKIYGVSPSEINYLN